MTLPELVETASPDTCPGKELGTFVPILPSVRHDNREVPSPRLSICHFLVGIASEGGLDSFFVRIGRSRAVCIPCDVHEHFQSLRHCKWGRERKNGTGLESGGLYAESSFGCKSDLRGHDLNTHTKLWALVDVCRDIKRQR
jgi:hypothetical protein